MTSGAAAAKVAGFAAVLVLVFAGAWAVGGQVGPVGAGPSPAQSTPSPGPSADEHGAGHGHE